MSSKSLKEYIDSIEPNEPLKYHTKLMMIHEQEFLHHKKWVELLKEKENDIFGRKAAKSQKSQAKV